MSVIEMTNMPRRVITESSGSEWRPQKMNISLDSSETLNQRIVERTPTRETLIKWTVKAKPPQEWYDEEVNPFEPE